MSPSSKVNHRRPGRGVEAVERGKAEAIRERRPRTLVKRELKNVARSMVCFPPLLWCGSPASADFAGGWRIVAQLFWSGKG